MISKDTVPFALYTGDDTTTNFAIPFPLFEINSLKVYVILLLDGTVTELTPSTDFSTNNLDLPGIKGSIDIVTAARPYATSGGLDVGYTLTVEFDANSFQPSSFASFNNSSPKMLENSLDRAIMAIKAMNYKIEQLDDSAIVANSEAIALLQDRASALEGDVLLIQNALTALELEYYSQKLELADNSSGLAVTTVDQSLHTDMIVEYFARRGSSIQYGRQSVNENLATNLFTVSPLEKIGDAGLTFSMTNAVGIGTLRAATTNTGEDIQLTYKVNKFKA